MRKTITAIKKMKESNELISMLTCTDASFGEMLDKADVDMALVGDSLGMVVQGHENTIPVKLEDITYHLRCVARGNKKSILIADMPFGTFQNGPDQAYKNACILIQNGAQAVKIEGGKYLADTVEYLTQRGIPVCGHIGLTPQSINMTGVYKIQGRVQNEIDELIDDGKIIENSGAFLTILELVPKEIGKRISDELDIPVIGIGAGRFCDGQVLNVYDILDIYQGKKPSFVKNFMVGQNSILDAIKNYVKEVQEGNFPSDNHSF